MLEIFNVEVYDLERSILASGYPLRKSAVQEVDKNITINPKQMDRMTRLGSVDMGTGHDSALKGIRVSFDITYPIYWTPQAQRYTFFDVVSSQSSMHCLTKFNLDEAFSEYVLPEFKQKMKELVEKYNNLEEGEMAFVNDKNITKKELFQILIANCPQGLEKTMRISTNYLQLKTMYIQRRHHKLKEWQIFCNWVETLPYFKQFCIK